MDPLLLLLLFLSPVIALNTEEHLQILRSEIKSLRSEFEDFKLENKRPLQVQENEEVLLSWLKRNVMSLRKELGDLESRGSEETRRVLGKEEELNERMEMNLASLRKELREMQRNEEGLKSLGADIQSNIEFYNRLHSPELQLLDSKIHIRSKKQMSRELRRMISVINAFFKRLSSLEVQHGNMESQLSTKETRCEEHLKTLEKRFDNDVQGLKNVSKEAFNSINGLDKDLNGKASTSLASFKALSARTEKALRSIASRQNDLESSMGEILRKFSFLSDTMKYHEKEIAQDSS
eukprot:TRINITY_DN2150_c0_g1_i3.p1 TRINITY_DN2150_c0_g1~~TRINITY_DN2150_c0_g1_i3.p1  ORF type:complete len:293 (+),score=97.99 TRINITY_DN2150_c0_g1_i3:113-991(+)